VAAISPTSEFLIPHAQHRHALDSLHHHRGARAGRAQRDAAAIDRAARHLGATNIRFLFGFPFSLIFFAVVIAATGDAVPWPTAAFWPWLLLGALSQIVGTGMMLLAMNDRSFVVTTAYLKTEAIQTAIFGFVFLVII